MVGGAVSSIVSVYYRDTISKSHVCSYDSYATPHEQREKSKSRWGESLHAAAAQASHGARGRVALHVLFMGAMNANSDAS